MGEMQMTTEERDFLKRMTSLGGKKSVEKRLGGKNPEEVSEYMREVRLKGLRKKTTK